MTPSPEVPDFGIVNRRAALESMLLMGGALGLFVFSIAQTDDPTRYSTRVLPVLVALLVCTALYGLAYLPSWLKLRNAGRLHCRIGRHFRCFRLLFGLVALAGLAIAIQAGIIDTPLVAIVVWFFVLGNIEFVASTYVRLYDAGFYCPAVGFVYWNESDVRIGEVGKVTQITFGKVGIEPVLLTTRIPDGQLTKVREIIEARRPARLHTD